MGALGDQSRCSQCGAAFSDATRPKKGLICAPCRRENGRRHYEANRRYYVEKARVRQIAVIAEVREWLLDYLAETPCIDCRIDDVRVLEFDHRDPAQKRTAVSTLATADFCLAMVKAEVAKCDVRCANCHRIKTMDQRSWWKGDGTWVDRGDENDPSRASLRLRQVLGERRQSNPVLLPDAVVSVSASDASIGSRSLEGG